VGSVSVHYFETGRGEGKVVEHKHQDGELVVASFPDFINGEGVETTLYKPTTSRGDNDDPTFKKIVTFRLGVGDITVNHDVKLWHEVSPLTPPPDGSAPRRRSFIVALHNPRTYRWLQQFYNSIHLEQDT
jgi:hypothetical protein